MQDFTRLLYGGSTFVNGKAEISILGFNTEGNAVTAQPPVGQLLNAITGHSDKIKSVVKASAIYFHTEGNTVRVTLLDDKMKLVHETLPLDTCWQAIENIGGFQPARVALAA
jgi:hypothetical protein